MQTCDDGLMSNSCCKMGKLLVEYDYPELDEELAAKWIDEEGENPSIRGLTAEFNKRLLQTAMDRGDIKYLEGEVDNTYRLLTDDKVTEGVRMNVRRALERSNVEIETVEDDFISHQTLYNHLTGCLGVSKSGGRGRDPVDKTADEIFSLQNRTVAVAEDKLKRLRDREHLNLAEFNIFVDISAFCESCETLQNLGEILRNGGCPCQAEH